MASPRIGRSVATEKNPLIKASNALAYQARKLREDAQTDEQEASPTPEAVLGRLRRMGDDAEAEHRRQIQTSADAEVQEILPLIDKVSELVEEAEEARAEARPVIDSITAVNWSAITRKLSDAHGFTRGSSPIIQGEEGVESSDVIVNYGSQFSTDSTKHRIARLQTLATELESLANPSSDSETRARLRDAEDLVDEFRTGVTPRRGTDPEWRQERTSRLRYAVNSLRRAISYGSLAESIRGKLAGVKKLLADIGTDVIVMGKTGNMEAN